MALLQNAAVPFNRDSFISLEKYEGSDARRRVGFGGGWKLRPRRRDLQLVNSSINANVETINGKKVNGNGKKVNGVCVERDTNLMNHEFLFGRFAEERFVFRQAFVIRSYEIGPDQTATMETLMNLLQETALNHVAKSGVAGGGFGATREMSLRKLIWVVTRIHVQIDKYSSWGDVVEIDTWVNAAAKTECGVTG
ncbi:palmitoyl-acyl carrier protein thioesterase, chloroplastic-like [Salvia divinorum]|uniref:Acyl-[acyl-carrier-protein] hydrolase n=1 Tax=Salvia divinorum TaxID=28513 RepID=A0ABD1HCI8_SALDI